MICCSLLSWSACRSHIVTVLALSQLFAPRLGWAESFTRNARRSRTLFARKPQASWFGFAVCTVQYIQQNRCQQQDTGLYLVASTQVDSLLPRVRSRRSTSKHGVCAEANTRRGEGCKTGRPFETQRCTGVLGLEDERKCVSGCSLSM